MYKVATFLVKHHWGQLSEMANGLGVLLLTWNQAIYRYGSFDFNHLERCISANMHLLEHYRPREIASYDRQADDRNIRHLFRDFLEAVMHFEG